MPAGADNANHDYYIKKIIETHNPLITYSQFPDYKGETTLDTNERYYPSLMHVVLAGILISINHTSAEDIIFASSLFMIISFIIGIIGYSLLVREVLKKAILGHSKLKFSDVGKKFILYFSLLCLLSFSILIYSISPMIKTINDGTYPEIFAMWTILPFYIYALNKNHWLSAGVLLAAIGWVHHLSLVMSVVVTIAFFSSITISREFIRLRKSAKFFITFGILSLPAFFLYYLPIFYDVFTNSAGNLQFTMAMNDIIFQLTPLLFYSALYASVILLINYKSFLWITIWVLFDFILFTYSSLLGVRLARESSVVFGLAVGICLAYSIHFILFSEKVKRLVTKYLKFEGGELSKIVTVCFIILLILPLYYFYQSERLLNESNPLLVMYYSDALEEANGFLKSLNMEKKTNLSYISENKDTIAIFGHNPWLKLFLYDEYNVFEVVSQDIADTLGAKDKQINNELSNAFYQSNNIESGCLFKKYEVDYIFVSDDLFGRYYTPYQFSVFYNDLSTFQKFTASPFIKLEKNFFGENQEHVRIYSIDNNHLKEKC
jgi:hypothetical protein